MAVARRSGGAAASLVEGASVHLLLGEERFLRDRRAGELAEHLAPSLHGVYSREVFRGPEVELDRVVTACETLPVFSDKRLVLVRDLDLKAAAAHAGFVSYLKRPNPSTMLILTAESPVTKRSSEAAEKREVGASRNKKGLSVKALLEIIPSREEFRSLDSSRAEQFVRDRARARGVEIAPQAAVELVELVGVDAARLDDEVEKAVLYARGQRRIEIDQIEALARRTRSHTMFELTDAIAEGDPEKVLRSLGSLTEGGSEPVALVGMIGWHLRRTLRGAAFMARGGTAREMPRAMGVHWRMADSFATTCKKLGLLGAVRAVQALRVADRLLKSTAENKRLVLERTILGLLPHAPRPRSG